MMETFLADFRLAARTLRRSPAFTLTATLTLALGIGANTAIFSAVNALLLEPLPYEDGGRIVVLAERPVAKDEIGKSTSRMNFDDWLRTAKSFESMGLLHAWNPTLTGRGEPARIQAALVTHGVFDVLRVKPALGRPLLPADGEPGSPDAAVVSDGFFRSRLNGAPGALGSTLVLNGQPVTVVGVLPPGFKGPGELDAAIWANETPDARDTRGSRYLRAIARLAPGVTLEESRAEMRVVSARLAEREPRTNAGMEAVVTPLREKLAGDTKTPLLLLISATGLLLLVACANLSNLLLARGLARRRELTIRAALGASRARVVRGALAESLLISLLGGLVALPLASAAIGFISARGPEALRLYPLSLDPRVLAFAAALSLATAAVFGLLPALRLTRGDLVTGLGHDSGRVAGGNRTLRDGLAAAQLAIALTLLSTSGLLLRSFQRLQDVEPGIVPDSVVTMSVHLPAARYPEPDGGAAPGTPVSVTRSGGTSSIASFHARLLESVTALPGVEAAALSSIVPFGGSWDRIAVDVEGWPAAQANERPEGDRYIVSPGYFEAIGVPLKAGRLLSASDRHDAPLVAVVDEVFAAKLAADPRARSSGDARASTLGMRLHAPGREGFATIVGIVGHVKHYGLDAESGGQIYIAGEQYPWRWMSLVVKSRVDAAAIVPTLRAAVRSLDPELAVFSVATLRVLMAERTATRRFVTSLVAAFAALALLLALIGLYGVVAYLVSQRKRELAIRMAIGARPSDILALVLRHGLMLAACGAAAGLLATSAAARLVRGLLFQVQGHDPLVLLSTAALLVATALAASALPARRAARVDPMTTLRAE